jgi:hypothetical protein
LLIHQDARIFLATLDDATEVRHHLAAWRHAWLQVLRGAVTLGGRELETSYGAAVSEEDLLTIRARGDAEIMLFDLA